MMTKHYFLCHVAGSQPGQGGWVKKELRKLRSISCLGQIYIHFFPLVLCIYFPYPGLIFVVFFSFFPPTHTLSLSLSRRPPKVIKNDTNLPRKRQFFLVTAPATTGPTAAQKGGHGTSVDLLRLLCTYLEEASSLSVPVCVAVRACQCG